METAIESRILLPNKCNTSLDICIVEDDKLIINILSKILLSTYHNVSKFNSYEKLGEFISGSGKNFNLGFYDFDNAFGMSGGEYFKINPDHHGRRILMSGDIHNWDGYTGIKLQKPFTMDEVLRCI